MTIKNSNTLIGKNLRKLRKEKKITLEYLSYELGFSVSQISKYEKGESRIPATYVSKVSRIIGVPVSNILNDMTEEGEKVESEKDKVRVFLIDDDMHTEYYFRKILDMYEHNIELRAAQSAKAAISYLREIYDTEAYPDIIFMDINMVEISGLGVLKSIRQTIKDRLVPVVMLSNNSDKETVLSSFNNNCSGYIFKEMSFNEFRKKINMVLDYWIKCSCLPSSYRKTH